MHYNIACFLKVFTTVFIINSVKKTPGVATLFWRRDRVTKQGLPEVLWVLAPKDRSGPLTRSITDTLQCTILKISKSFVKVLL